MGSGFCEVLQQKFWYQSSKGPIIIKINTFFTKQLSGIDFKSLFWTVPKFVCFKKDSEKNEIEGRLLHYVYLRPHIGLIFWNN